MSNIFIRQRIHPLVLDTEVNLASASNPRIYYRKPNGEYGYWAATIAGTTLTYNVTGTEIDIAGNWRLQAYYEVGGEPVRGKEVTQQFKLPIG
jgi:hypothetical protein